MPNLSNRNCNIALPKLLLNLLFVLMLHKRGHTNIHQDVESILTQMGNDLAWFPGTVRLKATVTPLGCLMDPDLPNFQGACCLHLCFRYLQSIAATGTLNTIVLKSDCRYLREQSCCREMRRQMIDAMSQVSNQCES